MAPQRQRSRKKGGDDDDDFEPSGTNELLSRLLAGGAQKQRAATTAFVKECQEMLNAVDVELRARIDLHTTKSEEYGAQMNDAFAAIKAEETWSATVSQFQQAAKHHVEATSVLIEEHAVEYHPGKDTLHQDASAIFTQNKDNLGELAKYVKKLARHYTHERNEINQYAENVAKQRAKLLKHIVKS